MTFRIKESGTICGGSQLNTHAMFEVIVGGEDWQDSLFGHSLDVKLPNGEWKDLMQACKDHDVITDNHNTYLHFPRNEEERKRGFSL